MAPAESPVRRSRQREDHGESAVRWQSRSSRILAGFATALFFARFFLPAESATQGDTLWIAAGWMVCGIVFGVGIWRGWSPPPRWDGMDAAAGLWIGGQIASSIWVISTTGDKRVAANLGWEWGALFIFWMIARHAIIDRTLRNAILRALMVTGTLLAGYGLYQHYVSHPQMVAEYAPLFDRLRTATGSESAAIKRRLAREGIPVDGAAAILFEKRLRDSSEPLALFALANTFGGFLAVALLLVAGEIVGGWRSGETRRFMMMLFLAAGAIGWCLLLTKSRTACVGTACGLIVLLAPLVQLPGRLRRFLIPAALVISIAIGVAGLLAAVGSLDVEVLSEAPKSLSYRLQYWQATSRLIAAHPWIGVGPGNFRQHYLQYKLPVASEEIADPHNLFFETAATGGVFSLAGLVVLLVLGLVPHRHCREERQPDETTRFTNHISGDSHGMWPVTFWLAGVGSLLAFFGLLFCWGEWEDRLIVLALLWGLLAAGFVACWPRSSKKRTQAVEPAAAAALVIHLLGAGGISMPAITQILLVLLVWSRPGASQKSWPQLPTAEIARSGTFPVPIVDRWTGVAIAIATFAALISISLTTLMPVVKCRSLVARAAALGLSVTSNADESERLLRQAAAADTWAGEPWRGLFERTEAIGGIRSNDLFEIAVEELHEVMFRDPNNFWGPRTLGRFYFQRWQITQQSSECDQAVKWLRRGWELYPTNSEIQAELAIALSASGDRPAARVAARGALMQDEIYRQQGHVDRYLPTEIRDQIRLLAEADSD